MKCNVKISENLLKELNHRSKVISLIMVFVGAVAIVLWATLSEFLGDSNWFYLLLCLGAIYFVFGIILLCNIKKITDNQLQNPKIEQMEFFADSVSVTTLKNDEVIATAKFRYSELIKARETENYIFLYPTKTNAVCADKNELGQENVQILKTRLTKENSKLKFKVKK